MENQDGWWDLEKVTTNLCFIVIFKDKFINVEGGLGDTVLSRGALLEDYCSNLGSTSEH